MLYADKEIELLSFFMIGAEDPHDENPPWSAVDIKWKGEVVPYINGITIEAHSVSIKNITIYVVPRKQRGYDRDNENFARMMREMKERGITIVGWPEEGDKA